MITPDQTRACRGYLDWTQADLAKRSNLTPASIRAFEKGRLLSPNNLLAIRHAFEEGGIEFKEDEGGTWTRLRKRPDA